MTNRIQEVQEAIAKARGGCIAVRAYDINGNGHIEAEIDRGAADHCGCKFCLAGDMTTSQTEEPEADNAAASVRVRALKDAAAVMCNRCGNGESPYAKIGLWWHLPINQCEASPIHDLITKELNGTRQEGQTKGVA